MEPENEKFIRQAYRDSLAEELARPEVLAQKEKLVAFFETPVSTSVPVLQGAGLGFMLPAVLVFGVFFFMQHLQTRVPEISGPAIPIYRTAEINPTDNPVRNHMKPRVVVKRISSRVGPTMVYQKVYRETPVTIVWVFNRLPLATATGGK